MDGSWAREESHSSLLTCSGWRPSKLKGSEFNAAVEVYGAATYLPPPHAHTLGDFGHFNCDF